MIRRNTRRAFTLIELLLVLVILAVLAGVAVPLYVGQANKAKVSATKATISNVKAALNQFEIEFERYPTSEEGLGALVQAPAGLTGWDHPFMEKMPTDGWGQYFVYRYPGTNEPNSYDLYSIGPDGQDGTNDDISKNDL